MKSLIGCNELSNNNAVGKCVLQYLTTYKKFDNINFIPPCEFGPKYIFRQLA